MADLNAFRLVCRISKSPVCLLDLNANVIAQSALFIEKLNHIVNSKENIKTFNIDDASSFKNYLSTCAKSGGLIPGSMSINGEKFNIDGARYDTKSPENPLVVMYVYVNDDFKSNINMLNTLTDLQTSVASHKAKEKQYEEKAKSLQDDHKRVAQLANYDSLTSLANKGYFNLLLEQALKRAIRSKQKVTVLFCDLDGFKLVNDSYGHDIGDKLLQHISTKLKAAVRETDVVARFGGDEFVILLENINEVIDLPTIIKRIKNIFQNPIPVESYTTHTTISIGIAVYPDDSNDADEIIKNADMAAYSAKKTTGSAHCYFSMNLKSEMFRFDQIEFHLKQAIANEQIVIYYQPQLDLKTKKVIGLEALCRWRNPDFGDVSPVEFFKVAERTGLIQSLNEYVFNKALSDFAKALKAEPEIFKNIHLSLNVSKFYLNNDAEFSKLIALVQNKISNPNKVCLEIGESDILSKPDISIDLFKKAKIDGVDGAIDNFGTGFVSLELLKKMPLSILKIDISFIEHICDSYNDFLIIRSLCSLGKSLGMKVIAEGVETEEQLNKLTQTSCKAAQGFYFKRAVPLDQAIKFIKDSYKQSPEEIHSEREE